MPVLICGSLAYDNIMVFHGKFGEHILPDQIHILNVAFVVPDMRREFGGTAGNIAYNLKLLDGEPLIMATVGDDFGPYRERLDALNIARTHIHEVPGTFVAQAFITTDLDANQITAFHPGAMSSSYVNKVVDAKDVKLGILAPDLQRAILECKQPACLTLSALLATPLPRRTRWVESIRQEPPRLNKIFARGELRGSRR